MLNLHELDNVTFQFRQNSYPCPCVMHIYFTCSKNILHIDIYERQVFLFAMNYSLQPE